MCMAPSGCAVCKVMHHFCVQIASAVFVRPPLATCGLTEQQAQARLTGDIDIFVSKFKPMKNTLSGRDEKTLMKIIVKVDTDEVSIAARSLCSSDAACQSTASVLLGVFLHCNSTAAVHRCSQISAHASSTDKTIQQCCCGLKDNAA